PAGADLGRVPFGGGGVGEILGHPGNIGCGGRPFVTRHVGVVRRIEAGNFDLVPRFETGGGDVDSVDGIVGGGGRVDGNAKPIGPRIAYGRDTAARLVDARIGG